MLLIAASRSLSDAQDMEPRTYSRAPVGTQTVIAAYSYQSGDVFTDAALPLSDVNIKINTEIIGYAATFGIAGKQANAAILFPYAHGTVMGRVFETQQEVTRSGAADLRMRFSVMLLGSPALKPKEFAATKPRTVVGASVTVAAPTGQYDPRRLVNIGSNRWSFKPEVGVSKPMGRWTTEAAVGVWLFTANNDFFGGLRREQKPILSLQAHVMYTLRPRMWLGVGGTYFRGGQTVMKGVENSDLKSNSRIGVTYSYPIGKHQSIKLNWTHGVTTRVGGDINAITVGWQYTWF